MTGPDWRYDRYDPAREPLVEALCTLGNGRFATRGSAPECPAGATHYPGTYLAGCYDRRTSDIAGERIENEDLVNLPNWTLLRYRCLPVDAPPGPWLTPGSARHCTVRLDPRTGVLTRYLFFEDAQGRGLRVCHLRLVHMGDPDLAAQRTLFRAYGWRGAVEVESVLDGAVTNSGVARYRHLEGRHLTEHQAGFRPDGVAWLACRTADPGIRIALAVRTKTVPERPARETVTDTGTVQTYRLPVRPRRTATVVKTLALRSSLDRPVADPVAAACDEAAGAPALPRLLATHEVAWARLWEQGELAVPGEAGRILRLHLFHLLQTLSPHTADLDTGVPARGLHGEAYRGHIFWDELFVLPYLGLHFPEVARSLLMYRYRRLPAARAAARREGRRGARYPWQSASSGREETQTLHLNPRSGRWLPDHSHLQGHVGSAIAHNVWRYAETTGDRGFLYSAGAEMLLEIARYWSGAATFDPALGRYRLTGVVGPDEYHDAYPDAATPGIDDNAYTNATAAWVLARGLDLLGELPAARRAELSGSLHLDDEELSRWDELSRRLYLPFHQGVISQFAGYGDLAELDWARYRDRYGDIRRLDRILEAEGDTVNRYQASKQADALMLGHLFRPSELSALFARLGYRLDDAVWRATVDHYLRRSSHGSTLSSLVHGWLLTRGTGPDAWEYCREALLGDIADLQGGTTGEGIHLGAMAGTVDLVERGLTGLEAGPEGLRVAPVALREIPRFAFTCCVGGHRGVRLRVLPGRLAVRVPASSRDPLPVVLPGDRRRTVAPGEERWFRL
ncbi:glycoside hydrolase family 65 protein [Streptomyces benahoarensis]|uniref:Glycoside hydrolase family 65 protein n=1 Tax=Streptomyces benahoarensis TaxID=2595054 RepID=A0A553ZNG8_9ACTN|nr:glycoside hydrolase family 65 protein [Streptomyces benahoarensis]TSB31316.1 glycoside hydrolase family 65 protein [Streptomyces benahoarensis]TSB43011.1 glycoside hydrolase family 65 protein [Streptomyces benahoarensis]